MKKSLLEPLAAEEIVARVQKLNPDSKSLWGEMNVTEMLLHCNQSNRQVLEEDHPYKTPTIKERMLKLLSLYVVPEFPKNIKGAERNDTKAKIDVSQFEEQKKQFVELVKRYPVHQKPMTLPHPAFGCLTRKQWGIAAWKHMDHHLRQFGV